MLAELSTKLREKFKFDESHIHAVAYQLRQYGERIISVPDLPGVTADPDDDKFVECAVAGNAQWLVSGDKHLLQLGEYQGIRIVTAVKFLHAFSGNN